MAIDLQPFDPAEYLKSDEEVGWFLEDALESGDARVLARALECATRAKGLPKSAEQKTAERVAFGDAPASELSISVALKLLDALGLSLRLTRETTAAAA